MKKTAYMLVALALLCAAPVFAQGPFTDVPTDHWAYDAVNQLQEDGIIIGYPDGTFGGKRTITRYEFAVALARLTDWVQGITPDTPRPSTAGLTKAEVEAMLKDYAKKSELPTVPGNLATKADVDAVRKLVDEFRDELAALGVDVDALKRDVAALDARVCILEAEMRRVRFTGNANVFAITSINNSAGDVPAVDLDNRTIPVESNLGNSVGVVRDFDLNIVGRVSESTSVNATINYGNYLNYVGAVDDYVGGVRPNSAAEGVVDDFFPYFAYVSAGMGNGNINVGRFPIAFTPYTLKKIDVDAYTNILKTDDGYYPMDGISMSNNFFGADVTLFAAKNDMNTYLVNGLTGQPNNDIGVFNQFGGNSVGGLTTLITQTAGARATFGIPFSGKMGVTYYQAWSEAAGNYDQARVFGGDLTVPVGSFTVGGAWTQSDTLAAGDAPAGIDDVTEDNIAWDGKIGTTFGKLGFDAGYKSIGRNFTAAGAWDKIGHWTNPVNIKGPYANFTYPVLGNLNLVLNGEFLTVKDPTSITGNGALTREDTIIKAEGGLQWGISASNSLALGYQYVKFDPDAAGLDDGTESYLTIGWAHKVNPDAAIKVGYQFINWDGGEDNVVYGEDYRGGVGVVQFGVSF